MKTHKLAFDDGWSVKSIWETLHEEGKITFSYQSFRNYVNSIIYPSVTTEVPEVLNPISKDEGNNSTVRNTTKSEKQPGFVFNPIPNKEELV